VPGVHLTFPSLSESDPELSSTPSTFILSDFTLSIDNVSQFGLHPLDPGHVSPQRGCKEAHGRQRDRLVLRLHLLLRIPGNCGILLRIDPVIFLEERDRQERQVRGSRYSRPFLTEGPTMVGTPYHFRRRDRQWSGVPVGTFMAQLVSQSPFSSQILKSGHFIGLKQKAK
jgi:hypothetical protein